MNSKKTTLALDTNTLLNVLRYKADVFHDAKLLFGEVDFVVPMQVIWEMEMLSKKGKKIEREVKIASQLMAKNGVKTLKIEAKGADEALLKLASGPFKAVIATNDKELKACVKELHGSVLFLRQKKYFELL